jgi:signal transduction histidine kinase
MAHHTKTAQDDLHIVLIVDDDKPLAQAIAATLDLQGIQTAVAYNGRQALEMARSLQPDLILLDVILPGQSGFEVCATLKRDPATKHIPIAILTVKSELSNRTAGITAGADAYLTKPFSPVQLIQLVNDTLGGGTAEPGAYWPPPSAKPTDQWMIYAQELTKLYEQERTARQELESALRRVEELNRLQAEFLGVITHELMTPFGNIGLIMEVIQQQSQDVPPNCLKAIDDLSTEIAGLHRMINGVVKFAELMHKQREPELEYNYLDQIILTAVQPVAIMAQAREVDFRCFVPPYLPPVLSDAKLLSEAVFQMVHNAIKFNKPGGQATVRAYKSDEWIVIEVQDNGIGLTPERLLLLGQPFKQRADSLRRGREGLGVGWAFVGYVAHAHSGWTDVKSEGPGQGSTFSLALPIVPQDQWGGTSA